MVIGLLTIASIPTVIGVAEAISAQKSQNASLTKEQEKFELSFIIEIKGRVIETGIGVLANEQVSSHLPWDISRYISLSLVY
jgi:hypothetical protein